MTAGAMSMTGSTGAARTIRAGVIGGAVGAVITWVYEIVVWVGVQHQMGLAAFPANGTGLVFGKAAQASMGMLAAGVLGTVIHFVFAIAWGVLFAAIWPFFRRRGIEATLVALFYAVFAWIVMHVIIMVWTPVHPDYSDLTVVLNGFMGHFFFAIPMALMVKRQLAD